MMPPLHHHHHHAMMIARAQTNVVELDDVTKTPPSLPHIEIIIPDEQSIQDLPQVFVGREVIRNVHNNNNNNEYHYSSSSSTQLNNLPTHQWYCFDPDDYFVPHRGARIYTNVLVLPEYQRPGRYKVPTLQSTTQSLFQSTSSTTTTTTTILERVTIKIIQKHYGTKNQEEWENLWCTEITLLQNGIGITPTPDHHNNHNHSHFIEALETDTLVYIVLFNVRCTLEDDILRMSSQMEEDDNDNNHNMITTILRTKKLIHKLMLVLQNLHEYGYYHTGLTPDNIYLFENDDIMIGMDGIELVVSNQHPHHQENCRIDGHGPLVAFTQWTHYQYRYMSPEYYHCEPFCVISNELWSIIMIIYMMMNHQHHHQNNGQQVSKLWNIPDPKVDVMFKHLIIGNGILSTNIETNVVFAQYIETMIQNGSCDVNDQYVIMYDIEESLKNIRRHPNVMYLFQNVFKIQIQNRITFQNTMEIISSSGCVSFNI